MCNAEELGKEVLISKFLIMLVVGKKCNYGVARSESICFQRERYMRRGRPVEGVKYSTSSPPVLLSNVSSK
jgi:hypothetical protein